MLVAGRWGVARTCLGCVAGQQRLPDAALERCGLVAEDSVVFDMNNLPVQVTLKFEARGYLLLLAVDDGGDDLESNMAA